MTAQGVVHCDLKPENTMLLRATDPKRLGAADLRV